MPAERAVVVGQPLARYDGMEPRPDQFAVTAGRAALVDQQVADVGMYRARLGQPGQSLEGGRAGVGVAGEAAGRGLAQDDADGRVAQALDDPGVWATSARLASAVR